jgi:hypothetical protein
MRYGVLLMIILDPPGRTEKNAMHWMRFVRNAVRRDNT